MGKLRLREVMSIEGLAVIQSMSLRMCLQGLPVPTEKALDSWTESCIWLSHQSLLSGEPPGETEPERVSWWS